MKYIHPKVHMYLFFVNLSIVKFDNNLFNNYYIDKLITIKRLFPVLQSFLTLRKQISPKHKTYKAFNSFVICNGIYFNGIYFNGIYFNGISAVSIKYFFSTENEKSFH